MQPGEQCDGGPGCQITCVLDTDSDGVPDSSEIPGWENNPDCDGTPDGAEISGCETNPRY